MRFSALTSYGKRIIRIEALIQKVRKNRNTVSMEDVKKYSEFEVFTKVLNRLDFLIQGEVCQMIDDVNNFRDPPYRINAMNARIGYAFEDTVDYEINHRYRTSFAYLNEFENSSCREPAGKRNLEKYLSMKDTLRKNITYRYYNLLYLRSFRQPEEYFG